MNRKSYLLTFFLIALVVGYGLYAKKQSDLAPVEGRMITSTVSPIPQAQEMTESEKPKEQTATVLAKVKTTSTIPNEIKSLRETFPDKDKVNEETIANPHTPSKTLMKFAKRLGPLMEKSFKDESAANNLVKELSDCAYDETVAKSARAMCVTSAERLAGVHSNIEKTANNLRAGVSPEVQKILNTNDRFIKKQ